MIESQFEIIMIINAPIAQIEVTFFAKYRTHTNSAPGYYFLARLLGGSSNRIFSDTRPQRPTFYEIKRGLLFEFSKQGLLLERGLLLVCVWYI